MSIIVLTTWAELC